MLIAAAFGQFTRAPLFTSAARCESSPLTSLCDRFIRAYADYLDSGEMLRLLFK